MSGGFCSGAICLSDYSHSSPQLREYIHFLLSSLFQLRKGEWVIRVITYVIVCFQCLSYCAPCVTGMNSNKSQDIMNMGIIQRGGKFKQRSCTFKDLLLDAFLYKELLKNVMLNEISEWKIEGEIGWTLNIQQGPDSTEHFLLPKFPESGKEDFLIKLAHKQIGKWHFSF